MMWTHDFWLKTLQEPANFWAMLTTVITLVLAALAYWQLRKLVLTSRSDFIYRLKKDFFTDEARRLIFLIENGLLEFTSATVGYFQTVKTQEGDTQTRMQELGITSSTVSTYLVDDILLGPLEDLGLLLKRGLVSLEETYEHFDTYVQICADGQAIRDYLQWSREGDGNEDVYDNFQELYERLEREGPKIRARKLRRRKGTKLVGSAP